MVLVKMPREKSQKAILESIMLNINFTQIFLEGTNYFYLMVKLLYNLLPTLHLPSFQKKKANVRKITEIHYKVMENIYGRVHILHVSDLGLIPMAPNGPQRTTRNNY